MEFSINFNEEKNQLLKASRGINFEDVVNAIEKGKVVGHIKHFKEKKYPNQFLLLIEIDKYIYVVPYVKSIKYRELYLKTVYPSRKFTKLYRSKK